MTYYYGRPRRDAAILRTLARIAFMIPAAVVYSCVHVARRIRRWYTCGAARGWPSAEAKVIGNFQMDENQVSFSSNAWEDDLDEDDAYSARWAVAIQYNYAVNGETYSGTYFLPQTYSEGDLADDAVKPWTDKTIIIRYNPSHPRKSFFLQEDGAPGKPHIPRLLSWKPQITELSLK
jgi:hypothetical protein